MGDELLSQIAQDVRDSKADIKHVSDRVDDVHRMLFIEGPAGKPPVHERLSNLETKSRIVDWVAGTIVGGAIIAGITFVASLLHIGSPR